MNEETAKRIVAAILDDLEGRAGFDEWWGMIDEETADEIHEELAAVVMSAHAETSA